jgi:hypothetical protein
MATENAAQGHTTIDEEESTVAMNWQSSDSNNNGSDNNGSYESPRTNSVPYYRRGGLEKD